MRTATAWLLLVHLLCLAVSAQATETLRWERIPLPVRLVVGQERVIILNRNVRVGLPTDATDALKVQTAAGAIYVTAHVPLASTRLQIQDIEDGSIILLDVIAESARVNEPALEPLRITTDAGDTALGTGGHQANDAGAIPGPETPTPTPIILTRHAAQSLYAPLRTVEQMAGISAVGVNRTSVIKSLMPLEPVRASPLAAWRLQNYWVTAVMLQNTGRTTINLDPRTLQGDFVAATFQHSDLGPAGDATDTTVVYLVTRGHGLSAALLPAISPFVSGEHHAQ